MPLDQGNPAQVANLTRRIKQNVHLPEHKLFVVPPPGLKDVCLNELEQILAGLIHPGKYKPQITVIDRENEVLVAPLDFRAMVQLPYQSLTARDMWWEVANFRADSMSLIEKGLKRIAWNYYLPDQAVVALKVDSRGSRLFHETMIKKYLLNILTPLGYRTATELDSNALRLELTILNNRLSLRISLASQLLYQRGYRRQFTAVAPLSEHLAAALVRQFWQWMAAQHQTPFQPCHLYVPFAGSGTLAWETLGCLAELPSGLWGRPYGMEQMPCFIATHFNFIKKQLLASAAQRWRALLDRNITVALSDIAPARVAEQSDNLTGFLSALPDDAVAWRERFTLREADFFQEDDESWAALRGATIFMPLNPPYGVRMAQRTSSYAYYQKLATRIGALAAQYDLKIGGFILAADEDAWRALKEHLRGFKHKSRHFMQGGRDIRLLNFSNLSAIGPRN